MRPVRSRRCRPAWRGYGCCGKPTSPIKISRRQTLAVFVNDVDLGHIEQGTVFYHDVSPGTYRLRAQPYGTPAHLSDTVQLGAGVTAFLQVQAIPNWEAGSTAGGASFDVLTMVPQDAEAAIPTLKFVGQR